MNGLALCSGIGGLDLGVSLARPDYAVVCYVESEAYASANLVSLMERGWLDHAPIWSDVRTFDGKRWRGCVDIVTAGFPCQPYSSAARGRNPDDGVWSSIARIISECKPAAVFLENVTLEAFCQPVRDLVAMGYLLSDPFACSSAEVGTAHDRRRVFVLAYADGEGERLRAINAEVAGIQSTPNTWDELPSFSGMVHGIPNRVDRDRALGNSVVPQQAAFAFRELMNSAGAGNHPTTPPESMRPHGVPADSTEIELTAKAGAGRSEVGS